ncbi:hypothetical protein GCM10023321_03890 [Pseudonocardia eucalypti]|uniref:Uncharacterized protein n=1 Tax=Pseudonocardia eucalypti TaxID=648755 RepID=A0ABP9PK41_9PSEU
MAAQAFGRRSKDQLGRGGSVVYRRPGATVRPWLAALSPVSEVPDKGAITLISHPATVSDEASDQTQRAAPGPRQTTEPRRPS